MIESPAKSGKAGVDAALADHVGPKKRLPKDILTPVIGVEPVLLITMETLPQREQPETGAKNRRTEEMANRSLLFRMPMV